MSEFTCGRGHLIRPSIGYCTEPGCGPVAGRPVRMDGMSAREIAKLEAIEVEEERQDTVIDEEE